MQYKIGDTPLSATKTAFFKADYQRAFKLTNYPRERESLEFALKIKLLIMMLAYPPFMQRASPFAALGGIPAANMPHLAASPQLSFNPTFALQAHISAPLFASSVDAVAGKRLQHQLWSVSVLRLPPPPASLALLQ